jgi:hypothetical protein
MLDALQVTERRLHLAGLFFGARKLLFHSGNSLLRRGYSRFLLLLLRLDLRLLAIETGQSLMRHSQIALARLQASPNLAALTPKEVDLGQRLFTFALERRKRSILLKQRHFERLDLRLRLALLLLRAPVTVLQNAPLVAIPLAQEAGQLFPRSDEVTRAPRLLGERPQTRLDLAKDIL